MLLRKVSFKDVTSNGGVRTVTDVQLPLYKQTHIWFTLQNTRGKKLNTVVKESGFCFTLHVTVILSTWLDCSLNETNASNI